MSKKTFEKQKLNKILIGVFVFFVANIGVFAKCSDYSKAATVVGPSQSDKKACTSAIEDGNKCTYELTDVASIVGRTGLKCYRSSAPVMGPTCDDPSSNRREWALKECQNAGYNWNYNNNCCRKPIATTTQGPFCGDGKSAMQNWSGKTKVTPEQCNGYKNPTWYSVWNSSSNCCSVTKRSSGGSSGGSTGGSSGSSTPTVSEEQKCKNNGNYWNTDTSKATKGCYKLDKDNCNIFGLCGKNSKCDSFCTNKVQFDSNYGKTLICTNDYILSTSSDLGSQVCSKEERSGVSINYPSSSKDMYREGEGQLIGWTSVVTNGSPDCTKGIVEKDLSKSYTINSSIAFYACYKEIINGERYLQQGAVADGGSEIECNTKVKIDYCNKENNINYCYFKDSSNNLRKVYRDKIAETFAGAEATCNVSSIQEKGYMYVIWPGQNYSCGDQLYITTCIDNACSYTKVKKSNNEIPEEGTVEERHLKSNLSDAKKACDKLDDGDFDCSYQEMPGMRTSASYPYCYNKGTDIEKIKDEIFDLYTCADGYYFDKTVVVEDGEEICDKNNKKCMNTFYVNCKRKNAKPTLSVTSGIVQSNGSGTIQVEAHAKEGQIDSYFVSDYYLTPTDNNNWIKVDSNKFSIEDVSPGVQYIWVRDTKGNKSNAVSGAVIDTKNIDTTVKGLQVYDTNGNVQNPVSSGTAYKVADVKNNNYVRLSNDLSKDSKVVADAFNPYDMEYKLEVDSPTVSVYATLTSADSRYVEGFEPRTVNLNYGINTILIKIQNKEGITRTYTILVTRTDSRISDNTLSDISLSVGNINFNANVTDYKIEIPATTTSVDVQATIASNKASYVSGYEPGNVLMVGNTTVKLITVKSETGRTRTYVLTFVKEGTDTITKESLQIEDLVIPGVYMPFEENVANYSLSVGYETDTIDINSVLKDKDSIASISIKKKSDTEYKVVSNKGIGLDVGENFIEIRVIDKENEESYYRLTIIRKEFGLEISNDTTLKDLKVLDYGIDFEPNKKEYTVRIKQEKSLVITAVPNSNRAEVFIRGNDELTGFSTVRVKVVAENGEFETYSIDIKKDAFNKTIEIASIIAGVVIILVSSGIIIVKKKAKANREYFEE